MGVAGEAVAAEATLPGRYSDGVLLMGVPWVAIVQQRLFGATPLAVIQMSHNIKDGLNCLCPAWLRMKKRKRG